MKPQQAEAVLNRFFEECRSAVPTQSEIEPVLDRVWERLEWRSDEFVDARMPATPAGPFRFAWAAGIVLAAVLINVVVWRHAPPSSVAVKAADEYSSLKLSPGQAVETLQLTAPRDVFELASVKLLEPSSDVVKNANTEREMQLLFAGCNGGYIGRAKLDPGRLSVPAITVLSLVIIAYGKDCTLVEGGPAWAQSDYYEINALLPAGALGYKLQDLQAGNAPRLQRMLQNLLADRFRLVVKSELREMSVYTLSVANRGKMKLSPDQTPPASSSQPTGMPFPPALVFSSKMLSWGGMVSLMSPSGETQVSGHAISMPNLAKELRRQAGRIVVDRTGLDGLFDFDLKFVREPAPSAISAAPPQSIPPVPGATPPTAALPGPPLRVGLEDQLGLKLESARMPIEVLIIESVERPSEN